MNVIINNLQVVLDSIDKLPEEHRQEILDAGYNLETIKSDLEDLIKAHTRKQHFR